MSSIAKVVSVFLTLDFYLRKNLSVALVVYHVSIRRKHSDSDWQSADNWPSKSAATCCCSAADFPTDFDSDWANYLGIAKIWRFGIH